MNSGTMVQSRDHVLDRFLVGVALLLDLGQKPQIDGGGLSSATGS